MFNQRIKNICRNYLSLTLFTVSCSTLFSQDISHGLVAYYSFCNCVTNDNSGNGNHGIVSGNPQCVDGIQGEALRFNIGQVNAGCLDQSEGDYVSLPPLGAIWGEGITICAWAKFEGIGRWERIVDIGNGEGADGGLPVWFGRENETNNLILESWITDDSGQNRSVGRLVSRGGVDQGGIHLYCATIEADTMKIYIDASLDTSKLGNPILNIPRSQNFIGSSNWCDDSNFLGVLDEVRIYQRALTLREIEILYNFSHISSDSDSPICLGESVQLMATGGISYNWTPVDFLNSPNIAAPIATPSTTTQYYTDIMLADGCITTDSILIEVLPKQESHISMHLCKGDTVYGYFEGGTYIDTLKSVFGCDSVRTLDLSMSTIENIVENKKGPNCGQDNGQIEFFTTDSSFLEYSLNDGPFQSDNRFSMLGSGSYRILVRDSLGCEWVDNFDLSSADCLPYIPTGFSPNGDGLNDKFSISAPNGSGIVIRSFVVFGRWGEELFKIADVPIESNTIWWDGTFKNQALSTGVYTYVMTFEIGESEVRYIGGTIALLR